MSTTKSKYTAEDKARLEQVQALVNDPGNASRFQEATTATEIREIATGLGIIFAKESGDIPKLIVSLRTVGVDFSALARQEQADRAAALINRKEELPVIRLACAAIQDEEDPSIASYAVVDRFNRAVIYGDLFDNDYERLWTPGDALSAEQSAADKAVFIASRARVAANLDGVFLHLTTTCFELDTDRIMASGGRLGVAVEVECNPEHSAAVVQAGMHGYKSPKQLSTETLAALIEPTDEVDDEISDPMGDEAEGEE